MHWLLWTAIIDGSLAVAAVFSRKANYYRRMAHYVVCVILASIAGLASMPVLWAAGRRASCNWVVARTFYFLTWAVLGITVEIEGEEIMTRAAPCVLIGNHQSMLDLIMLGRVFPQQTVILAKKAISYYPLIGWFMRLADDIFISRGSRQSASDMFKQASRVLQSKRVSVWFFPEGTRGRFNDGPNMLPFKVGAFLLAYHAKVPIVPVVVMDIHNIYDKHSFWSVPGKLRVKVLDPIPMDSVREEDLKDLMNSTRERMMVELRQISPAREQH
ncbi:1-acylglycerol-3-phosphate O-acyltransferase [Coemansia erecta]|uniref:1-acyl-sn-glycerol-3-phosphate acyltransferase n=1 Tax=Coemansia asiatica TaxID=1052880 RepID=A0A9W7XNX8_9FUNG|nr:1-acylglycerol-3-phosphate O-acyltransferase [Coemansia asiatica]KAJ2857858.1 1-acylglycerol-3-phosphate O-acyltransferase [Coemansia erecta]